MRGPISALEIIGGFGQPLGDLRRFGRTLTQDARSGSVSATRTEFLRLLTEPDDGYNRRRSGTCPQLATSVGRKCEYLAWVRRLLQHSRLGTIAWVGRWY